MEFIKSAVTTPMFGNVNEVSLSGETLTMEDLNSFLTLYPNLDVLKIKQSVDGKLNKKSKILEVKNVWLSNAGQFGMNLLTKFTGQNIYLNKVDLVESGINKIIRKWINNEGYQNLVSVHATMDFSSERFIQTDQVFNKLPVEWFNPRERQEHVEYTTKVFGGTLDIGFYGDNCYDVVRKNDGKKASIRAEFFYFRMGVWN